MQILSGPDKISNRQNIRALHASGLCAGLSQVRRHPAPDHAGGWLEERWHRGKIYRAHRINGDIKFEDLMVNLNEAEEIFSAFLDGRFQGTLNQNHDSKDKTTPTSSYLRSRLPRQAWASL